MTEFIKKSINGYNTDTYYDVVWFPGELNKGIFMPYISSLSFKTGASTPLFKYLASKYIDSHYLGHMAQLEAALDLTSKKPHYLAFPGCLDLMWKVTARVAPHKDATKSKELFLKYEATSPDGFISLMAHDPKFYESITDFLGNPPDNYNANLSIVLGFTEDIVYHIDRELMEGSLCIFSEKRHKAYALYNSNTSGHPIKLPLSTLKQTNKQAVLAGGQKFVAVQVGSSDKVQITIASKNYKGFPKHLTLVPEMQTAFIINYGKGVFMDKETPPTTALVALEVRSNFSIDNRELGLSALLMTITNHHSYYRKPAGRTKKLKEAPTDREYAWWSLLFKLSSQYLSRQKPRVY